MPELTQKERVLRVLRAGVGVTAVDFQRPDDGGPPILRLAARIDELRADGYIISSNERRNHCAVYRLIREPAVAQPEPEPAGPVAATLFDTAPSFDELVPEHRPRNAIFDTEEAA